MAIRAANAPCSWGVLEFSPEGQAPGPEQVLDEIAATGYAGTELGDYGFLPDDPARLREELGARALDLVGAFVPVALVDEAAHDAGEALAVKTARLLAASTRQPAEDRAGRSHRRRPRPRRTGGPDHAGRQPGRIAVAHRGTGGRADRAPGCRADRAPHRVPPSLRDLRGNAVGNRRADGAHVERAGGVVPRHGPRHLRRRQRGRDSRTPPRPRQPRPLQGLRRGRGRRRAATRVGLHSRGSPRPVL